MKIKDYMKLYACFIRNSVIAQMQYKTNFVMSFLTEVGFIFAKALYIIVLFEAGLPIHGLKPEQMLMFIGSYTFVTGVMDAVCYPNIAAIPQYIRTAALDLILTKPGNSFFMAGFRRFDLGLGIPNVIGGIIMIVVSWQLSDIMLTVQNVMAFTGLLILGCIITFPILMIPVTISFWTIRSDSLMDIIWAMWDFNNMPMTIYNKIIKTIGIFVIPIFMITNLAPMYILGILPASYLLFSFITVPLLFIISVLFWNQAIKSYTSASS